MKEPNWSEAHPEIAAKIREAARPSVVKENGREYWVGPLYDEDGVQASSGIGVDGKEYPDPVPLAPPVGYNAPPDLMQMIRSMIRNEQFVSRLSSEGWESFEEADDFDIEEDPLDPLTEYEKVFEPRPVVANGDGAPQGVTAPSTASSGLPPAPSPVEGAVSSPAPGSEVPKHSSST